MAIDTGGPAYPDSCVDHLVEFTMLDEFALSALEGLTASMAGIDLTQDVPDVVPLAHLAYRIGRAMVAEKRRLEKEGKHA